jgi:hypothetical protein
MATNPFALSAPVSGYVGASNPSSGAASSPVGSMASTVGATSPAPAKTPTNPYTLGSSTAAPLASPATAGTGSYYGPGPGQLAKAEGFDPRGGNEESTMFQDIAFNQYPGAVNNAAFGSGQDYARQQAIQNYINSNNPASLQSELQKVQAGNTEQGALAARNAALESRAAGLGTGYEAGAMANAGQQAQIANASAAQAYAPSGPVAQQMYQNQMNGFAQAYTNPELQTLMQLWSPIENQETANYNQRGQGLFGAIAPIVGQIAGKYL